MKDRQRLGRVIDVRSLLENARERELERANGLARAARERKDDLETQRAQAAQALGSIREGAAADLSVAALAVSDAREVLDRAVQELGERASEVDRAAERLAAARRDLEALEVLRSRIADAERARDAAREQEETDDAAARIRRIR
jgi:flagellar export protein FliJ